MQVPLSKPQPWVFPVTVVCLALGALIASMMNTAAPDDGAKNLNSLRPEEQLSYYRKQNEELAKKVRELEDDKQKLLVSTKDSETTQGILKKELNNLRILSGSVPLEGAGIVITIDDTNIMKSSPSSLNDIARLTHDVDLMLLVNELHSADAEAIALNDQRVVGSTAIRCVGPVIQVNHSPISAPFVIRAIGKPDVLAGAVNLPFGVLDQLRPTGIQITVAKRDKIRVPAMTMQPPTVFGTVVPEEKAEKEKP